jgi:hypothetical protein
MSIYQCPSCKTRMVAELRPDKHGKCIYCNYTESHKCVLTSRGVRESLKPCQICSSFYEYAFRGIIYCNNCNEKKRYL